VGKHSGREKEGEDLSRRPVTYSVAGRVSAYETISSSFKAVLRLQGGRRRSAPGFLSEAWGKKGLAR